jgi:sugar lactone lactonase YvrE
MFRYPFGIAGDSIGNLYISDYHDHRIRWINFTSNTISTFAGTGVSGYNGDGIPAKQAKLNTPSGIFIDPNYGHLYIADTSNHRIRMVNILTKTIQTIAGTGGRGYNVEILSSNNLNNRGFNEILAIQSNLSYPIDVFVDTSNNIFIANTNNLRIRKVVISRDTGDIIIFDYAGNGYSTFDGDGGQATSAQLCSPSSGWTNTLGITYISDSCNCRIRQVSPDGIIATYAGSGKCTYNGEAKSLTEVNLAYPSAITGDRLGNIYFLSQGSRLRKIEYATQIVYTIAGDGSVGYNGDNLLALDTMFSNPNGFCFDSIGNVYIADTGNNRVRKIDGGTLIVTTIAGNSSRPSYSLDGFPATSVGLQYPYSVWVDKYGIVYVIDASSSRVRIINRNGIMRTLVGTGRCGYSGEFVPPAKSSLCGPSYIIGDDQKEILYICDQSNLRIRAMKLYKQNGVLQTIMGTGDEYYDFNQPQTSPFALYYVYSMWFDTNNDFYLVEADYSQIRKTRLIDVPTSQPSSQPSRSPSNQPTSQPTRQPSRQPTTQPTRQPSSQPTSHPLLRPTSQPSSQPTSQPSFPATLKGLTRPLLLKAAFS